MSQLNSLGLARQHPLQTWSLRLHSSNQTRFSVLPKPPRLRSRTDRSHVLALDFLDDRNEPGHGERGWVERRVGFGCRVQWDRVKHYGAGGVVLSVSQVRRGRRTWAGKGRRGGSP